MKHFILTFLFLALLPLTSFAQSRALGDVVTALSFGTTSNASSTAMEAELGFPMNNSYELTFLAGLEHNTSDLVAALSVNLASLCFGDTFHSFELWAQPGFGWGHDFRSEARIDHNYHTYHASLVGLYNIDNNWSLFVKPQMIWRDTQCNLGFHNRHAVITVGVRYCITNNRHYRLKQ